MELVEQTAAAQALFATAAARVEASAATTVGVLLALCEADDASAIVLVHLGARLEVLGRLTLRAPPAVAPELVLVAVPARADRFLLAALVREEHRFDIDDLPVMDIAWHPRWSEVVVDGRGGLRAIERGEWRQVAIAVLTPVPLGARLGWLAVGLVRAIDAASLRAREADGASTTRLLSAVTEGSDLPALAPLELALRGSIGLATARDDDGVIVALLEDARRIRIVRLDASGSVRADAAVAVPGQPGGERAPVALLLDRAGDHHLVWYYGNGKTKREVRDRALWIARVGGAQRRLAPVRLHPDRELAAGGHGAFLGPDGRCWAWWTQGLSKRTAVLRLVRRDLATGVSEEAAVPGGPDERLPTSHFVLDGRVFLVGDRAGAPMIWEWVG